MNQKRLPYLIAGGLVALSGLGAMAQSTDALQFPSLLPPRQATENAKVHKAPLNQERARGQKIFGTTQVDATRVRSYANLYSADTYNIDRINPIIDNDEANSIYPPLYMVTTGAMGPDNTYYAYKAKYYTIGSMYQFQWVAVDPETGDWDVVREYPYNNVTQSYPYDLAWNPVDEEMYVLQNAIDGTITTRLGLMDLSTGEASDWIPMDYYYFCMAYDQDANMYAIRWKYAADNEHFEGAILDIFDSKMNLKSSRELIVDGKPFMVYYQNTIDVDPATGMLYWGATNNEGYQSLVRINPDDASCTKLGNIGYNEVFVGFHVCGEKADDPMAPSRVDNIAFTPSTDGSESLTLSWTNPSLTANRNTLSNLSKVLVYRDDRDSQPIATLDAAGLEGKGMTYVDNTPKGKHSYYVVPVNAKGNGPAEMIEAWSGHDTAGPVQNLVAEVSTDGKSVTISWKEPVTGDSNGWFDKSNLTYNIVRLPDNKVVVEGHKGTRYGDRNIPEAQFYSYQVIPVTPDGEGTPAVSNGVLAGQNVKIPFSTDFETANEAARFLSFDSTGYQGQFTYSFNCVHPGENMDNNSPSYSFNTGRNDVMFCTPPLSVEKGKKYRVDYVMTINRHGQDNEDVYHAFKICAGPQAKVSEMTNVLADYPEYLTEGMHAENIHFTEFFEAPVDGEYYVGFYIYDPEDTHECTLYMEHFSIDEAPDNDLGIESFDCPAAVGNQSVNAFNVEVINNGINTQDKYALVLGTLNLDNSFREFARTEEVPSIASHKKVVVKVYGQPADMLGTREIVARIEMEGDGNERNNVSEPVLVEVFDGNGFAADSRSDYRTYTDTHMPMCSYTPYSLSQTVYPMSFFGLEGKSPEIKVIGWPYRGERDMKGNNVRIFLGATDFEKWTTASQKTAADFVDSYNLVFEGQIDFAQGDNMAYIVLDNSFTWPEGKNLVVTVQKENLSDTGEFPVHFKTTRPYDLHYPSMDYTGNGPASPTNPSTAAHWPRNNMPVLYIGGTGFGTPEIHGSVETIGGAAAGNISFDGERLLISGFDCVNIYDLQGRAVAAQAVAGEAVITPALEKGFYVVKALRADGSAETLKINVK